MIITVGISFVVALGLYKIISIKEQASTATDFGRKWLAWMVFICTMATFPAFIRNLDIDSFAIWTVGVICYGAIAFIIGWIYGKFFGRKQEEKEHLSFEKTPLATSPQSNPDFLNKGLDTTAMPIGSEGKSNSEFNSSTAPSENETKSKKCPFCAETIKFNAIKCRYCKEMLKINENSIANNTSTKSVKHPLILCPDTKCWGEIDHNGRCNKCGKLQKKS